MTPIPSLLIVVLLVVAALIAVIAISTLAIGLFFFIRSAQVLRKKGNSNV